ncbi:putative membrane protein [Pectobacterium atrosepticum SCRI1043]|uniref:Membrane protein n=1 Tax=Pectobacterium atrosepticum (strain SCRI 1043 / ATCC BAA-672) TaxID=218491 RepID=Q6D7K3_PECAS|nr:zinc ribbon domain-containing protein [Pectobacterium atrosepticum]GKV86498.1 zinc ribbon domain-containing protein [Pectobacterium carotovorum subsp. carotovorum]AIA70278.1 hypothetical protein EV46_06650 [Pectobacterium atrosepticum]AIK13197.1 putative membrane protein [Pectobacterium atrosepticum]ATY90102.1 zinc ribbon domain-containing protein [Pectobacterium atrosepticum]KFX17024.1 membrane protein [Pectobacterium atrosepticum]
MALTKCKECRKEVSTSEKICPHCGIKDPGVTLSMSLVAVVILVAIGWGIFHWVSSDDENTEPKTCSPTDGQCLFKANVVDATVSCKPLVEKASKYDYEWADDILDNIFSRFLLDSKNNQLTFIGDKIKFKNGFNAKMTMTYACTLDLKTKETVNFDIAEGKL